MTEAVIDRTVHLLHAILHTHRLSNVATPRLTLLSALDRLAQGAPHSTESLDAAVSSVLQESDGSWLVSDAYWRLRREECGTTPGLVFTPPDLAETMVSNLLQGLPVVDLCAGTGMLALHAAERGYRVTAVERDPELTRILASLAAIKGLHRHISIITGDAFDFSSDCPCQIISNPPYTRHQALTRNEKRNLRRLADSLGVPLHGSSGHYAYFMIHAWTARWSKHEVLLVPTNWLETRYGAALRDYLASFKTVSITPLTRTGNLPTFRHSLSTSCVVTTIDKPTTRLSTNGSSDSRELLPDRSLKGPLTALDSPSKIRIYGIRQISRSSVMLGDILRVRRGIATGANEFFVVSEVDKDKWNLPDNELVEVVRKLRHYNSRGTPSFLWVPSVNPSPNSLERIKFGEALGYHRRSLCRARQPWWRITVPSIPTYLIGYMGRDMPTIISNYKCLMNLNNIHGVDPRSGMSIQIADRLVGWLASSDGKKAILERSRFYQGGLWKIEPGDMNRLVLPTSLICDLGKGVGGDHLDDNEKSMAPSADENACTDFESAWKERRSRMGVLL